MISARKIEKALNRLIEKSAEDWKLAGLVSLTAGAVTLFLLLVVFNLPALALSEQQKECRFLGDCSKVASAAGIAQLGAWMTALSVTFLTTEFLFVRHLHTSRPRVYNRWIFAWVGVGALLAVAFVYGLTWPFL